MKEKIINVLFDMMLEHLDFSSLDGCDYFKRFLINNNVSIDDIKNKNFYDICKEYWDVDLDEAKDQAEQEYIDISNSVFADVDDYE